MQERRPSQVDWKGCALSPPETLAEVARERLMAEEVLTMRGRNLVRFWV